MDNVSKTNLSKKIEDKLDDFFGEQNFPSNQQMAAPSLEKLKSMILSIDWEITDECLTGLIDEADALIPAFQNDRPTSALLRMLKALGNYIRKHKAQAHQEAMKRIMSVFSSLESIVQEHSLDENRKKQIVAAEIKAFNALKDLIGIQGRAGKSAAQMTAPPPPHTANAKPPVDITKDQEVKKALLDLEARMNTQIEQLKNQLAVIKMELANYLEK